MIQRSINPKAKLIAVTLFINFLVSWTILPFAVPPFRIYSFSELFEVILWQGMGIVGWLPAILGGLINLIFQGNMSDPVALLPVLIYPTILLLLILVLFSKYYKLWMLIILHILLTFSFAAIWYQVLNGYDFMIG